MQGLLEGDWTGAPTSSCPSRNLSGHLVCPGPTPGEDRKWNQLKDKHLGIIKKKNAAGSSTCSPPVSPHPQETQCLLLPPSLHLMPGGREDRNGLGAGDPRDEESAPDTEDDIPQSGTLQKSRRAPSRSRHSTYHQQALSTSLPGQGLQAQQDGTPNLRPQDRSTSMLGEAAAPVFMWRDRSAKALLVPQFCP